MGAAKQRLMTSICFRAFKCGTTLIISAFAQVYITFLLLLVFSPENRAGQFQAYILLEFTLMCLEQVCNESLTFLCT